jgi:hypothetical protein
VIVNNELERISEDFFLCYLNFKVAVISGVKAYASYKTLLAATKLNLVFAYGGRRIVQYST